MNSRRDPYSTARARLVEQLRGQGIRDPRVLNAIGHVPRELFVPLALRGRAYEDVGLPIGRGQTISQPTTVARMCELLGAPAGVRVLEIGAGTGYHAAVLAEMGLIVYSVERDATLARRAADRLHKLGYLKASVKHFDGTYGWAAHAPYRGIVVTAAAPEVPAALVRQLEDGGRMVLPLVRSGEQRLTLVVRRGDLMDEEDHGAADFVPLVGKYAYPETP